MKKCILLFFIMSISIPSFADRPYIVNIYSEEYRADNKNWAIDQDERGFMYFGNNAGLLEFDGINWDLKLLPNESILRSIAVLDHNTIYTGGYEEFGRWDRDVSGELNYTSLSDSLDRVKLKNADFWKIHIVGGHVYFQSFNSIFVYDNKTITQIGVDKNFLFLSKVNDELWTQEMGGALYRVKSKGLEKIEGSDLFIETDARVILPFSNNKYLIGTSSAGIYIYDGKTFSELDPKLSAIISSNELNCGLRTSRGTYMLGTILGGIFEINEKGEVIDQISSSNFLQNNTILSLYEDDLNNVWAGLDRGISYIQYFNNMSCYTDPIGRTGAVYTAVEWKGKLFLGTNQGVFYMLKEELNHPNAMSRLKLIEGTQGQVWSLRVINDRLYYNHNRGLREISSSLSISNPLNFDLGTGIFQLTQERIRGRNVFLLSTYTDLRIVDQQMNLVSELKEVAEPLMAVEVDHLENIWMEHANRGVYRCKLNSDLSKFQQIQVYGGDKKDGLPYKLVMFKVGGRIVLLGDDKFYTYDDIADKIIPNDILNERFKEIKGLRKVIPIGSDDLFWAITGSGIYKFSYDGYQAHILERYNIGIGNLSLVNKYENIAILNDSTSLVCLGNGFLLYTNNKQNKGLSSIVLDRPFIESMKMVDRNGDKRYNNLSKEYRVSFDYNTISFTFSAKNIFASNLSFQYFLQGVDGGWSDLEKVNQVSYARLPQGKYTFMVRTVDNLGNYSEPIFYTFEVLSPWYQTWWAYLLYLAIIGFVFYLVWLMVLRRYRNLHLKKIRRRESRRLRVLNEKLLGEIEEKNAELFTQTSFIIQKNELLLNIKNIIDDFYNKYNNKALAPLHQKITGLLNQNLHSEEDWKMFLIKFEQKHTNFFKKLRTMFPQLTSSDLRLCACLRLHLETKEIASLMNTSVRAIENSRYRLRKKLNLSPSQSLGEFLIHLD